MGKGEEGLNSIFSRTTLAHAVSGAVGSILAMGLTYPLDRVRTMKQLGKTGDETTLSLLKKIIETESWHSLYKGLGPMVVALGTSNFVYFYWFTALKAALQLFNRNQRKGVLKEGESALTNLGLASVAGTINVLITTPLWVAYTRLAIKGGKSGIFDTMKSIADEEGVPALWSGLGPSLVLVSNPSVQFASYEWMKNALLKFKFQAHHHVRDLTHIGDIMDDKTTNVVSESVSGSQLSSLEYLYLGAIAKMIATLVTYPIQVAQTRLRAARSEKSPKYTSTRQVLLDIYEKEGVAGLYKGMEAKMLQTCLTSAFMFASYEAICRIILRFFLWRKFSSKSVLT